MTDQSPTLFLIGPGYSASCLAGMCLDTGQWRVIGTARSGEKAAALEDKGLAPVLTADRDAIASAARGSHWIVSTPPGDEGCPVVLRDDGGPFATLFEDLAKEVSARAQESMARLVEKRAKLMEELRAARDDRSSRQAG